MKYDFVAIGDITIDVFIKLKDAEVHCNINNTDCELCVKFGQKIPFEEATEVRAVGNAGNAAVAAKRIGMSSALITRIGNDDHGDQCLETLKEAGVADAYIERQDLPTNYHYVLMYGPERTILVKQAPFVYTLPAFEEPPKWLYLTSLGEHAKDFHHEIASYVRAHPETKLAFQPGTFQIKLGADELKDLYAVASLFVCNKEEAKMILKSESDDIKTLLEGIRNLGPAIVIVTDGPKGSNILDESGAWHIPMYPDPAPPVSRTGAGDATASTTTAYIGLGHEPKEALMRGLVNAASVVQGIGAQTKLLTHDEIEAWYGKRPAEFKATAL